MFARARENARRTSCSSNLKQIGLGLLQYSQDYDEKMVAYGYGAAPYFPSTGDGVNYKWMDAIYPYVKSEQLFNCPSMASVTNNYRFAGPNGTAVTTQNYGSYGVNMMYRGQANPKPPIASTEAGWVFQVSLAEIDSPATTVQVGDNSLGIVSTTAAYPFMIYGNFLTAPQISTAYRVPVLYGTDLGNSAWAARHLETINLLYADGHVKSQRLTAISALNASGNAPAFTVQDD